MKVEATEEVEHFIYLEATKKTQKEELDALHKHLDSIRELTKTASKKHMRR